MYRIINFILVVLLLAGCKSMHSINESESNVNQLYLESVANACLPTQAKVYDGLFSITAENNQLIRKQIDGEEYILTVSWKNTVKWYVNDPKTGFYNSGGYQIWVTAAPQLLNRVSILNMENPDMRLKQLLGLPPNSEYGYFVEFWVKPTDLFRPCPDNEIDDYSCDLCFPEHSDSTYIQWINESRIDRYYPCDVDDKYPWTQLGYTYDWNPENKSHVGLSEYVIDVNKDIIVHKIYTTEEYIQKSKAK
ncbi:MAG: hypothetical protein JEZ03_06595 [Bacteroidales bacterium]|nr:hypothetical protein [Bacteroidales bacterium]